MAGFSRIDYFSARLSLPKSILDNAKHLYKRIETGEFEMKKIRKKDTLVVVCIKFPCTNLNVPRTFKELSEATCFPNGKLSVPTHVSRVPWLVSTERVHARYPRRGHCTHATLDSQDQYAEAEHGD